MTSHSFAATIDKRDGCGNANVNVLSESLMLFPTSASSYCASYLHLPTSTITTTQYPSTQIKTITSTVEKDVTNTVTSTTTTTETVTPTLTTTTTTSIPFITDTIIPDKLRRRQA